MKNLLLLLLFVSFILFIGCSQRITGDITANKKTGELLILNDHYRTYGAPDAILSSYGRILRHDKNRYVLDGYILSTFNARDALTTDVNRDNITKLKKLGFKLSEAANANLGFARGSHEKYRLLVVKPSDPSIYERKLADFNGTNSYIWNKMKNKNFRYISSVVYIVDHNSSISTRGSLSGKVTRISEGITIDMNSSIDNNMTIILPNKQLFAYQVRRLCWENGKVVDSVRDQIGVDSKACGQGYYEYPGR